MVLSIEPPISPAVESQYQAIIQESSGSAEYPARVTVPPEGWLRHYVEYATSQTDAPRIYHVACGLTLLAAAAGNSLYLFQWGHKRFLNLWTVLIGASTTYRKSTSIHIARNILKRALPSRLYSHSWSIESLQASMSERPAGLIEAGELSALTQEMGREYNKGAMQLLTRLYDGETYTRQTNKGTATIENPAPCLLAASTPEWLAKGTKAQDTEAGWLPRMFLVVATKKEMDRQVSPDGTEMIADGLAKGLLARAGREGLMRLSPSAAGLFHDFGGYQAWQQESGAYPPEFASFYARRQTDAVKIAALLTLGQKIPSWEVGGEEMRYAIDLMKATTQPFVKVLGEEISYSREGDHLNLVRRRLRQAPGQTLARWELMRKVQHSLSARQLDAALEALVESQQVEVRKEMTGSGRPGIVYHLLDD